MNSLVLHIETWASAVIIHLQISCSCSSLSWADLSLFDHLKFWASDIWLQKKPRSRITRLLKFIIVRISLKMQDHCHERWLTLNSSKILIFETQDQTISCPLQAITISHTWSVLWRQVQWTLRIIKYLSSLTCPVFADIFARQTVRTDNRSLCGEVREIKQPNQWWSSLLLLLSRVTSLLHQQTHSNCILLSLYVIIV